MNDAKNMEDCLALLLVVLGALLLSPTAAGAERMRLIIDTDAMAEVDDQHALAYALFSGDHFEVEGITVNRGSDYPERTERRPYFGRVDIDDHFEEAVNVARMCDSPHVPILKGPAGNYRHLKGNVNNSTFDGSDAVNFIIERAHAPSDRPLIIYACGNLTNVALALLKDPTIAAKIEIWWLGTQWPNKWACNNHAGDLDAVDAILANPQNVPFNIIPWPTSAGVAFKEIKETMTGRGPQVSPAVPGLRGDGPEFTCFGDYSVYLFDRFVGSHQKLNGRSLLDVIGFATVKNNVGKFTPYEMGAPSFVVEEESETGSQAHRYPGTWVANDDNPRRVIMWRHPNRDAVYNDFFHTMDNYVLAGPASHAQEASQIHHRELFGRPAIAQMPNLRVSENQRFLVREDGTPFFWLGDTAWELFHRLNREEADRYLKDRAAKGFTVIQAVVLAELDGLGTPNAYGHRPLLDNDPARPDVKDGTNNDYWDHVDYIVNRARSLGMYIGLLPTWGDKWNKKWGVGPEIFTPDNAGVFGRWLGQRYKDASNIIWILGGDRPIETEAHQEIIEAMARGLAKGDGGRYLMTFHPMGGQTSSKWFHKADWLDFNMLQSGHNPQSTNYVHVESDYALEPPKPTLDGEPAYEYPPDAMPAKRPVGALQVRRNAYWAVFAGGFGHTYGTHPIWQMYEKGREPLWEVVTPWHQALDLPGATQLIPLKHLMLSRPFLTRIPDQTVIVSEPPTGIDRVQVTRDGLPGQNDATYILAYFPSHQKVTLNTGRIASKNLHGWWYNPRTGGATSIGELTNDRSMQFAPPTNVEGEDWVLVLDNAASNYPAPGTPTGDIPSVYYVGGENASDTNPGTKEAPFATISRAAELLKPGGICYVRAGTYRETVTPKADGVTFRNFENEYVLITGLDIVTGWSRHRGNIVTAAFTRETPTPFKATQVFVNGERMHWARYPNQNGNMLSREDMAIVNVDLVEINGKTQGQATVRGLPEGPQDHWKGAYFMGHADQKNWWTANKGLVTASAGNTLTCGDISPRWRDGLNANRRFLGDGIGYLIGHLDLLDSEKEWHWQNDTLYLYPPSGTDPSNALVEARKRIFGFELTGRTGVTLQGLHFKAAALKMENAKNCTVDKCTFRYASTFTGHFGNSFGDWKDGDATIHVSGNNNTIRDCYIGHTWGHGVSLWGSHQTLENCIIEHCNWMGERMSPVFAPGDDNIIRRNTIRFTARDGIELGNRGKGIGKYARRALIQYNHVHNVGYLCPDAGLLYVNHQSHTAPLANTEISYNVMHDYIRKHGQAAHGGIYYDNNSSGYTIHHNVIWNVPRAFTTNGGDNNIYIYHNTLVNVDKATHWTKTPTGDIVVRNNISTGTGFTGVVCDHNREVVPLSEFVDPANRNYRLKPSSLSIDKGVALPGVNDGAINAPDLGAYEYGGKDWTAGADIQVPDFPDARVN